MLFRLDIRAAYMVVLDDNGLCPLGRDEDLPAGNKQGITAAPKEEDHQEQRRQSNYVLEPLNHHLHPGHPHRPRPRPPRSRSGR